MQQIRRAFLCCLQDTASSDIEPPSVKEDVRAPWSMGHLKDLNISYFQHLAQAWKMAFWFGFGAFRLIIHGILPNFDINAGHSTTLRYTGTPKED